MKSLIDLLHEPNQEFTVNIFDANNRPFSLDIKLRTINNQTYMDLFINGSVEFLGKRCCNNIPLVANNKLNGNLYFKDLFGNDNPKYTEFNDRFALLYDTEIFWI